MADEVTEIRKAAEQGNADAQQLLGSMYMLGLGVENDEVQAFMWLRKAAEQGNAAAQLGLGTAYAHGHGVAKNDVQAVIWWSKSAEQGHKLAQAILEKLQK